MPEPTTPLHPFGALADALPAIVWTAAADGTVEWHNARFYAYTGLTPEQFARDGWAGLIHPDDLPAVAAAWRAGVAAGTAVEVTFRLRGADGRYRRFLTRAAPVRAAGVGGAPGPMTGWVGTNTDVEAEWAAREAAERARADAEAARAETTAVLEAVADAHFVLDARFRITAVNAAMERGCGLARAELLGRDFWAVFPAAVGTAFERHYRRAAVERVAAHFTHDYSDGRLDLVVDVDAYPGPDGGVAVFWRDVTARARAEAALAAGDARYRALLDSLDTGFCVLEVLVDDAGCPADWRFLETNPAFVGQVPYGDPGGRRMREIAPDLDAVWFEFYGRVAATGEPARVTQAAAALGRVYEVFAYRVDDPALRHVAVLFTDVTAREEARRERERLLAEAEAARAAADLERRRLLATLDQLPVGVHVAEAPSGRLLLDNAALRRIVGEAPTSERVADYSADYADYRPGPGPDAERRLTSEEWPLARALATGEPVADELVEVRRADGTRRLVRISATPVRDAEGRVAGGVAAVADVTEREELLAAARAAADAERAARAAADAANEAKSQFLANMSHELRTPLNAIGGYTQLLDMGLHGPVTDAQREALGRVTRSQQHLLGLINDVLNYAKLEAGKVEYAVEEVELGQALAEAAAMVEPQARARGLVLDVARPDRPCWAWADPDKLRQVVLNLLSNAVKFTPGVQGEAAPAPSQPGRVTVRVAADTDAAAMLRVEVEDTGVGIPADRLEAVFAPFVQVRAGVGRPAEGTGLGLAISRDLARGMGGDLTAASAQGAGSTFTLALRRVVTAEGDRTDRRTGDERRVEEERREVARRLEDLLPGSPPTDGAMTGGAVLDLPAPGRQG